MAWIQKTTPPPNKVMTFSLKNFVGGLNNRSDSLEPNQTSDSKNMTFTNDTVMERRKGQMFADEIVVNGELVFQDEHRPYNDTDKHIRATNTQVYVDGTLLKSVVGRISGTNFKGKYFFTDGDKLYAYGKYPQTSTTYEKVIGTPDANYILMEVVNPPESYTALDSSHTKGVVNYDYTNKKVWYEPCEKEKVDTFKGANVLPEKPKYIVVHQGRLFLSGSDKDNDNVFISDIQNPYYFPVVLPMQLPPNSDKVVGLGVYDDSVIIGRNEDVHVITGMTNRDDMGVEVFRLSRLNTHTGFANQQSVTLAHNFLFFMGNDGNAYSLSNARAGEKVLSTTLLSRNLDITKDPLNLSLSDVRNSTAYFHDDKWYVSIGDKVLVYSYRDQAWTYYTNFHARSFYKLNDVLVWGNKDGRLVKHSEDYLDFGKPYESYWMSKHFDMDDANAFKQFREFFIVAHTFEKFKSDVRVTFEIDYADVKSNIVIQNQISVFGRAVWGDRFINRNINASAPFSIGQRGRLIRFILTSGYDIDGTVSSMEELNAYPKKREGALVYVSDVNQYHVFRDFAWVLLHEDDYNQPMKIYQVNGDYEYRGKR